MSKLSGKMQMTLHDLATRADTPGRRGFHSGFPTYDAPDRRGLVKIGVIPRRAGAWSGWYAELTEEGWAASGVERPAPLEEAL